MTRDNELNGLEHYERFLDAQRFGLTEQEQDLFHKALRRSVRPVITSKEPPAPMTRDKTTNPGAPMSDERLAEIESWLLDDPDFYINCTERQATDAIRELLAAVRVKECDPDKKCLLGQQLSKHIDYWSGKALKLEAELTAARTVADGEVASTIEELNYYTPGMLAPRSLMKQAADLLTRLSAAKEEAERERDALRLEAVELAASLESEERKHENTVKQRDEAEEAVSDTYFAVMGEAPEWSNRFGYPQALEDIKGAHKLLGDAVRSARADALEDAAKLADREVDRWQGFDSDREGGFRAHAKAIRALKPVQGEQ